MFKNINTTQKHNQSLQANLGTVLPSTLELIGGRYIIYQTVTNIKIDFGCSLRSRCVNMSSTILQMAIILQLCP